MSEIRPTEPVNVLVRAPLSATVPMEEKCRSALSSTSSGDSDVRWKKRISNQLCVGLKLFNRKLFPTTLRLDTAIAALATIGLNSNPVNG